MESRGWLLHFQASCMKCTQYSKFLPYLQTTKYTVRKKCIQNELIFGIYFYFYYVLTLGSKFFWCRSFLFDSRKCCCCCCGWFQVLSQLDVKKIRCKTNIASPHVSIFIVSVFSSDIIVKVFLGIWNVATQNFYNTVKLGYNDHGFNEFTVIPSKLNKTFWSPSGHFIT